MVKLKSFPNKGTRKLILPVIGEAQFTEGVIEVPEDKVEELLKCKMAFKLAKEGELPPTDKKSKELDEENGGESELAFPMDSFKGMRVKDLVELAESAKEAITEEEMEKFNKEMNKDQKIEFLFDVLNNRSISEDENEELED